MKNLARLSFLIITILWGSFYSVAKEALGRTDPVIFTFFQMIILVPIAITLIAIYWKEFDIPILKRGVLLGSWLCLAMLTMTMSLEYTQANHTAFFPSIGGITGALITGVVLRRPLKREVWIAGGLSLIGVAILLFTAGGGIEMRGDLIALLGSLFFTVYVFLVDYDRQGHDQQRGENVFWVILGIEHLTIAFWLTFIVLLFGDWQHFSPTFPKDAEVIVYLGVATALLPVILSTFMQKYIRPLEISFISILEPIWGVLIAFLYLGELVPWPIYVGGGLVIAGSVYHTWGSVEALPRNRVTSSFRPSLGQRSVSSKVGIIGSPLLLLGGGIILLNWLGGFPPTAWFDMLSMWPDMQDLFSQGQGTFVLLVCLRAACWFVAWGALVTLGIITAFSAARRLLSPPTETTVVAKGQSQNSSIVPVVKTSPTTKRLSTVAQRRQTARLRRHGLQPREITGETA